MMRQHVSLNITAVGRVKASFAYVVGELGPNVTQGSVASNYKGTIHAKFGANGFTDAQFPGGIPHQLREMTRLVLVGLIVEIVTAYLVIPGIHVKDTDQCVYIAKQFM